jgi:hypothetical protein
VSTGSADDRDRRFPTTQSTWIERTLAEGAPGAAQVIRHVMERYRAPLEAYAGALPARSVAEPSELVAGFFARRVAEIDFFSRWRASGLPLRRYLMHGLSLDARGVLRSERREAARRREYASREAAEAGLRARAAADAEAAFERAWARAVVAEACGRVREALEREQDGAAWQVFEAHLLRGESYAQIAGALGRAPADPSVLESLAVAARRVGRRMRVALREVLVEEGVEADELERELRIVATRLQE